MKTEVQYITPDQAQAYLSENACFQRAVRRYTVKQYAAAMQRGEWKLTHQGIAIDVNGKLIDGQHRLLAVIESGITVPMTVTTGVSATAFSVLDIGAKRDISDLLSIPKREAAVLSRVASSFFGISKLSSAQANRLFDFFEDNIRHVVDATGQPKGPFTSAPAQVALMLHCWDNPADKDRATNLFQNIINLRIEELPPVGVSLVSQAARGMIGAGSERQRKDILFRTLYALDPSKTEIARVALTPEHMQAKVEYFREKIREHVEL